MRRQVKGTGKVWIFGVKPEAPPDPRGRLDVLLLGIGKLLTRKLETAFASRGLPIGNLWDGPEGVEETVQRFCKEQGIAGKNVLSPVHLAERSGLLKKQKRIRKGAA